MIITISGSAGTGKSTLAKALADQLELEYVCAGKIIREMADEQGMDIVKFGEYLKEHPELDKEVDDRIIAAGKKGNALLEGRLVAWMMINNGIPAFKVLLKASPKVASLRILKREGGDEEEEMKKMQEREATNWKRYSELYGIDSEDEAWYDLVLDTDEKGIAEVFALVSEKVRDLK